MEELFTQNELSILALIAAVLPLLSFLLILFFSRPGKGAFLAILSISISFILASLIFFNIWNKESVHQNIDWVTIGQVKITAGIYLNNLSALMLILIPGIALLVHIYSLQYMKNDPYLHRYWAYLGLFCFSMMALVITSNLLLVYMFWELVGFSSYLLIGFWFTKETAVQANKKAFIVNRIGDLGFLIGIMILLSQFHTLDIRELFSDTGLVKQAVVANGIWSSTVNSMPEIWVTAAGGALFFGAVAKSAQFPLHTWLPDAMEGPTAVSSLIHAATMVAAGVFLVARIYPVFDPVILKVITVIGCFTAFMAATIALVQNDIKKILAFSTISQLGFMMLAMGIGAYGAGIFHLTTHAFFKCLLFLAAGSVIHEMQHVKESTRLDFDHQDIRNMGGLRKQMPVTFVTMLIASLALAGLPLTSGYLSKDAILIQSFEWSVPQSGVFKIIPYLALFTSWLTAFYISRLIFKVFFGNFRFNERFNLNSTVHESPKQMIIPLIILAVCCLYPLFAFNPLLFEDSWLLKGLPVLESMERVNIFHTIIPAFVNLLSIIVIYSTYILYVKRGKLALTADSSLKGFLKNQWYINELYNTVFVSGVLLLSRLCYKFDRIIVDGIVDLIGKIGRTFSAIAAWIDCYIVDGAVNGSGSLAKRVGTFTRHFQTGSLQHYLITMLLVVLTFFIIKYFSPAL
ncbi:NADH-quinone oxidoreductase subunit L [Rubrolithibacter danxiaensis]|uniref:NADH-quinone oxidoreductase subunit L n=1 Tax=Rubrolithibacter danxiaensis TaxID=3390805 RepID=UPI003BF83D65